MEENNNKNFVDLKSDFDTQKGKITISKEGDKPEFNFDESGNDSQGDIQIYNDAPSDQEPVEKYPRGFFDKYKKVFFGLAIAVVVCLLASGGAWGMEFYEKYYKTVPLETILPANPNIALSMTINPDSEQFKLLEQNMEKIPGYSIMEKDLDKAGEGKTLSQAIQDKLKEENLDFENDIKPAISDKAIIIIPDASHLGENLQGELKLSMANVGKNWNNNSVPNLDGSSDEGKTLASIQGAGEGMPQVLGDSWIKSVSDSSGSTEIKPTDYLVASHIKDLKKAKDVLQKMKKDGKYTITEEKYDGYAYYKVKMNDPKSGIATRLFPYGETYHAILGGNWVMSSSEDYMKGMISRKASSDFLSGLFHKKGQNDSLATDADYQKVSKNLFSDNQDSLLNLYLKLNFNEFFNNKNCGGSDCVNITDYVKYPSDIVMGYIVKVTPDGIKLETDSNKIAYDGISNNDQTDSLAYKLPQNINSLWANFFLEHNNIKDFYYNFKKNNLTDKGLKELNDELASIKKESGIDVERDFIDLSDGSTAWLLYTGKGVSPKGALVSEVSDSGRMIATMQKVVEMIKNAELGMYSRDYKTLLENPNLSASNRALLVKMQKKNNEMIKRINQSEITEKETPGGKVYSYQVPLPEEGMFSSFGPLVINYAAADGRFIFSGDADMVASLLPGNIDGSTVKISDNDYYKKVAKTFYPKIYSSLFIGSSGIVDAVDYYRGELAKQMAEARQEADAASQKACENAKRAGADMGDCATQKAPSSADNKMSDEFSAVGAVIRTLKLWGGSEALNDNFDQSSLFVNIQELPKDEKDRADSILKNM